MASLSDGSGTCLRRKLPIRLISSSLAAKALIWAMFRVLVIVSARLVLKSRPFETNWLAKALRCHGNFLPWQLFATAGKGRRSHPT
jgi:hypothetical protein